MAGAALLAEPRSPHTHTHMQEEEEEEEGGPCIFMPGSQEGAGPAGTANRGPLAQSRPAGTAGTARPLGRGSAGRPAAAQPGRGRDSAAWGAGGGSNAPLAISPLLVISPAICRGGRRGRADARPAWVCRAGLGGEGMRGAGMRGRPPAGCTALHGLPETKEIAHRQTDGHPHPATPLSTSLPAGSPPAAGIGTGGGNLHPSGGGRHRANFGISSDAPAAAEPALG